MTEPEHQSSFAEDAAKIRLLNREERWEEALAAAAALVERFPDDPRAHFEYAGALDYQGREMEAVAPYRKALALGLSGDDLPLFYVQFGSTLRNAGELDESITLLREGSARFPDFVPIRAFLALALLSAGRGQEAVVLLLDIITSHAGQVDLAHYERALRAYTDELRESGPGKESQYELAER